MFEPTCQELLLDGLKDTLEKIESIVESHSDSHKLPRMLENLNYLLHLTKSDNVLNEIKCRKGLEKLLDLIQLLYEFKIDDTFAYHIEVIRCFLKKGRKEIPEEPGMTRGRGEYITHLNNIQKIERLVNDSKLQHNKILAKKRYLIKKIVEKNELKLSNILAKIGLSYDEILLINEYYENMLNRLKSLIVVNRQQNI